MAGNPASKKTWNNTCYHGTHTHFLGLTVFQKKQKGLPLQTVTQNIHVKQLSIYCGVGVGIVLPFEMVTQNMLNKDWRVETWFATPDIVTRNLCTLNILRGLSSCRFAIQHICWTKTKWRVIRFFCWRASFAGTFY